MNSEYDKISDYINSNPKESLLIFLIVMFFVMQSVAALIGILSYFLFVKVLRWPWWIIVVNGMVVMLCAVIFEQHDLYQFIHEGFQLNISFWHHLILGDIWHGFLFLFRDTFNYLIGLPLLFAGILSLVDLIPNNPHAEEMAALCKAEYEVRPEISDKKMRAALGELHDEEYAGTVLGVSKYTGKPLVVRDKDINQVLLVLGTTGSGKTITLRRFFVRAIIRGYPLIVVDGKPDDSNIEWLMALAKQHGRAFYGFNCGNFLSYDPLAKGGYTELKDKIISLKDEWSSDYYRSIAEDYLQTTLEVLIKSGKQFDLKMVVEYLNYDNLAMLIREMNDESLTKRVESLKSYDRADITGLQAHLNILLHSELGEYFDKNETTFTLGDAILQNAVVYFALPALRFPSFSKVLGKLVINDLKAVIDRNEGSKPLFTVFDEFSVFAGEQVLNLVNMGRGKGVHAIFGTQGLGDLEKVDATFKSQILNCVNTLICHRLNDQESAESVASWIGTRDSFTVTAQLNIKEEDAKMGSVRRNKEFIVHPDDIKQGLATGEAYYVTKVGIFKCEKMNVKFI